MVACVVGVGAVFASGALCLQLRNASPQTDSTILELADGREVTVTAHVVEEGNWRAAGFGGSRQSLDLETEEVVAEGQTYALRGGLRLNIYSKERQSEYPDEVEGPSSRLFLAKGLLT